MEPHAFLPAWLISFAHRIGLFWLILGALLLVSTGPLAVYHWRVLRLTQRKLLESERLQQTEITRSIAGSVLDFHSRMGGQLLVARDLLAASPFQSPSSPASASLSARATPILEAIAGNNSDFLLLTFIGSDSRGESAGSIRPAQDPFLDAALRRALLFSRQGMNWDSPAFALSSNNQPAVILSYAVREGGKPFGMLAAVVSLEPITALLRNASVRDRTVLLVDAEGRILVSPEQGLVPGRLADARALVAQFREIPPYLRTTESLLFLQARGSRSIHMLGTYTTIPELHMAVIATRGVAAASADAGARELTAQALSFMVGVALFSALFAWFFAAGITRPVRDLAESARAISRGDYQRTARPRGSSEIRALAEAFNLMAAHIQQHINSIRLAAEETQQLFLGSIRMITAAVDEKDPYTRGHSGRVAKFAVILGEMLGLLPAEVELLRLAALLHDVGKIGVDDLILRKPGRLSPDELSLMRQHPSKGANILRPVARLAGVLPGIEFHHEQLDGSGYPRGLRGEEIPLQARIIAVADALDAITTSRPYQSAQDLPFALRRIRELAGSHFDPRVVDALEAAVRSGRIRIASLVEV